MVNEQSIAEARAISRGEAGDPFGFLGLHDDAGGLVIRAFAPGAETLTAIDAKTGRKIAALEPIEAAEGVFIGKAGRRKNRFAYRLRATRGDAAWEFDDAYRFGPVLGEIDEYLLGEGAHRRLWEALGAHPMTHEGADGVHFAVWAPNARRVSVVGDFNLWDGRRHAMRARGSTGVWEIFVPGLAPGAIYKYEIMARSGAIMPLKADPVGFGAEMRPSTASVVRDLRGHAWRDDAWMTRREAANRHDAPISIYEVHLGSWRRAPGDRPLSYREHADQLVGYAKEMGFTHIELMPVSEHPFDGSWGYQPVGLYAPTARFGDAEDFRALIEAAHAADIGVILDWVPAHFPTDAHGPGNFDGEALYEHADPREGYHPDWNTLIFNLGRREVANYLLANALYWLDAHHVDGLRVDAVASMLYRDYSRKDGEWIPNKDGGRENLESVDFLRRMNELAYATSVGAMTIAEESTAWPGVSRPTDQGGLGFGFKWNMGWMHDTLSYMSRDPIYRKHHHNEMTFGLIYAFSENFILPLSHDEVVHGKGSLLAKMPGDDWRKFANLRAYFGFMWAHPGKKLLFMGGEFAQGREWSHERSLDWHLLQNPAHAGVQSLVRDLNAAYRDLPALWRRDGEAAGFDWVIGDAAEESVFGFVRKGAEGDAPVLAISNMTPIPREGWRVGVPRGGYWRERINTDAACYGGGGLGNGGGLRSEAVESHGHADSLVLTIPPLATIIFEWTPQ